MRLFRCALALSLVLAGGVAVVTAPASLAGTVAIGSADAAVSTSQAPPAWSEPTMVAPYVGAFSAVSCPSTTWCMAADWSGQVLTYDGTRWSAPRRVVAATPLDDLGGIVGLSCATTSFCVAGTGEGLTTYRSGTWSAPVKPGGTGFGRLDCVSSSFCLAANSLGQVSFLRGTTWTTPMIPRAGLDWWSVSCATTSFCMTVGQDSSGAGYAMRWNGSTWTLTKIEPAGYSTYAVSCPTTTFCMVTDGWGKYVRYTAAGWGKPAVLDSTGGYQGRYLSCPTPSFCAAFDVDRGVRRWNGSTWSAPKAVDYIHSLNGDLSCASSTMCVAVEQSGRYARLSGTTWQGARNADPTSGGVRDLACPSPTQCVVTDQRRNAQQLDGTSWSAPTAISSHGSDVSCPNTTWCLTMDPIGATMRGYNPATRTWAPTTTSPVLFGGPSCTDPAWCFAFDDTGRAVWGNGKAWGTPRRAVWRPNASFPTTGQCLTHSFCMAISSYGDWSRWNGSSWSAPRRLPGLAVNHGASFACASASMCLAVGDATTWRYDGLGWQVVPPGGSAVRVDRMVALSCVSTTFCAGLTLEGDVGTFNGSAWSPTATPSGLAFEDRPTALECPAVDRCVAAGIARVTLSSPAP